MRSFYCLILFILFLMAPRTLSAQADNDPPQPPVLNFLTIQPSNGSTELNWIKSSSPDVAGYIIYRYANGWFAIDTIHDPQATDYINLGSAAELRVESYVIAALDTAGNASPLSNELNTMFVTLLADSCNRSINLSWNSYSSTPKAVTRYTIQVSENGGTFNDAGEVPSATTSFTLNNIKPAIQYCFLVKAELDGGLISSSSKPCRTVQMERAPDWINADYATVNDENKISLSFTIDPMSEIRTFRIDRKKPADPNYDSLSQAESTDNRIEFTDQGAKTGENYIYRILAKNRCGVPAGTSNIAGNIVLEISGRDLLGLNWNGYRSWNGGVNDYKLFMNTGSGFNLKTLFSPTDTSCTINYHDIMNQVTTGELCFYIESDELTNQYGITGRSRSNTVCLPVTEKITVPNAFTPNNDLLNDQFKPVLSFTPSEYHLLITDRQNNKLFEATDPEQSWDGTRGGSPLPRDVYLWFLRVKTPSGKVITKTGTVAIVKTR